MNFLRKNWYYLGALLLVALAAALSFIWGEISTLRAMMLLSFMALLAHQFEEYAWPGGFPAVINLAVMPSGNKPDRYPLNRMTSLFVNVIFAYPFYLGSVLFCNQVWLGLGLVLFGMFQLGFHGIQINKKMQSIYNPGLFTAIVLFWPIGIYYMWYVADQNLSAGGCGQLEVLSHSLQHSLACICRSHTGSKTRTLVTPSARKKWLASMLSRK